MELRSFLSSTFVVDWVDGTSLTIPSVTYKEWMDILTTDVDFAKDVKANIENRYRIAKQILNKNIEKVEITDEALENVPVPYINAFFTLLVNNAMGLINSPNSKSHSQPTENNEMQ